MVLTYCCQLPRQHKRALQLLALRLHTLSTDPTSLPLPLSLSIPPRPSPPPPDPAGLLGIAVPLSCPSLSPPPSPLPPSPPHQMAPMAWTTSLHPPSLPSPRRRTWVEGRGGDDGGVVEEGCDAVDGEVGLDEAGHLQSVVARDARRPRVVQQPAPQRGGRAGGGARRIRQVRVSHMRAWFCSRQLGSVLGSLVQVRLARQDSMAAP